MYLTDEEVQRFYSIWFPLLHYVNQQRRLLPHFPEKWVDAHVDPQDAVQLRDALWTDDSLREAFISHNPAHLAADDLALVDSWKYRVAGDFYVFRYLKKHTVFLSTESPMRAYGVLGIVSPIEEILGPYLPILVQAVLLPFGDRIIYDSLLSSYSIYFGGGWRGSLKDAYRQTQEREGIITSLTPNANARSPETVKKHVQAQNRKILTAFQKSLGQAGLSPKMMEEHTATLAVFANEFLLAQTPPVLLLDINRAHVEAYLQSKPGHVNVVSFKRFVRFMRDTGRLDYEQAEALLDFLKRY